MTEDVFRIVTAVAVALAAAAFIMQAGMVILLYRVSYKDAPSSHKVHR